MKCAIVKKAKFIKEQEPSGLLSSLEINTPLNKYTFCFRSIQQIETRYKLNEIVNNFLLLRDNFMPEMHKGLGQPGFKYSVCGSFPKN